MTREKHLLGHLIFQTNEGDVAVASKQRDFMSSNDLKAWIKKWSNHISSFHLWYGQKNICRHIQQRAGICTLTIEKPDYQKPATRILKIKYFGLVYILKSWFLHKVTWPDTYYYQLYGRFHVIVSRRNTLHEN
jgi:hypothetical protein